MSPILMAGLTKALSAERLAKYRQPGESDAEVLARYMWNQAIADCMNRPVHICEVTFRNTVFQTGELTVGPIANHGGVHCWLDASPPIIKRSHHDTVAYAREELRARGVPRTTGRLIAELSFGFWVLLFGAYYDQGAGRRGAGFQLWTPANLRSAFPNVPSHLRDREQIRTRFDAIAKYRNRLAHHEPIYHMNPTTRYQEIVSAIRWISADAADYVDSLNELPTIIAGGPAAFLRKSKSLLGHP